MGTTAEKLTYLNTTKGLIKDSINLTGAGITNDTFRSYANKLKLGLINALNDNGDTIYSNLEKVSGKGSNLSLTPTYEAPMRNKEIYGNTSQSETPTPSSPIPIQSVTGLQNVKICGKNLFDKDSGFRLGYIDASGTFVNQNQTACFNQYIHCKPSTTYTLSFNTTMRSVVSPLYYDKNKTFLSRATTTDNIMTKTITTPGNCYYMVIQFNYDGSSTMTQEIIDSVNCQLELGSTATTYEPYKGNTYEVNLGKNLLDSNYITTKPGNGIFNNGDGTITFNGTVTSTNYSLSTPIILKANTTYCLSITNSYSDGGADFILRNGSTNVFLIYFNAPNKRSTFRPTEDTVIDTLRIYNPSVNFDNYTFSIQLEIGETQTSFSPYFTPIELNKIGDYEDSIKKSTGKNIITTYNYASSGYINYNYDNSKIGKTMTYSFIPNFSTTNATLYIRANTSISSYNVGTISTITSGTKVSVTFTLTDEQYNTIKNTTGGYIQVYKSGVSMDENSISNPMLEENSQATTYEPYLPKGTWYIEKQIGKVVLDGSESINLLATLTNVVRFEFANVINAIGQTECYSNYNEWYSNQANNSNFNSNDSEAIHIRDNGLSIGFKISKTIVTTKSEFQTWLSTHNVEVKYILSTPTYEVITNESLINELETLYNAKSKNGTTNIVITSNDLSMIMSVSVIKGE